MAFSKVGLYLTIKVVVEISWFMSFFKMHSLLNIMSSWTFV